MKNFHESREIYTPFFSKKAYDILRSVLGQLSDGLFENARGYTKYWINFNVERKPDGQVYFAVNKDRYKVFCGDCHTNPFIKMTDADFLNWVSVKLKTVILTELKDNSIPSRDGWKRNNTTFESEYLSYNEKITVADIYVIYDWLRGRKIDMSSPIVKDVFGNPRSEKQIKKIEDKQSEIDFIQANRDNVLAEIKEKYNDRIADLEDQLAELKEKMEAELKTVNTDCNAKVQALREELEKISA
jgi:hypothetical protein